MVSAPAPPSRMLSPPLPVMALASALPVPLMLPLPVERQVLDIGAERVGDRGDCTVSVPSLAFSVTTSPALSTT